MNSLKFFFVSIFCLCCLFVNAQASYKDVTVDRDFHDNQVVVIHNYNKYPVQIRFQFKVGSRDTEWINFPDDYHFLDLEAHQELKIPMGSKIYGLNLIYVDILQPSVGEKIIEGIGLFGKGMQDEINRRSAAELNGNQ